MGSFRDAQLLLDISINGYKDLNGQPVVQYEVHRESEGPCLGFMLRFRGAIHPFGFLDLPGLQRFVTLKVPSLKKLRRPVHTKPQDRSWRLAETSI